MSAAGVLLTAIAATPAEAGHGGYVGCGAARVITWNVGYGPADHTHWDSSGDYIRTWSGTSYAYREYPNQWIHQATSWDTWASTEYGAGATCY